MDIGVGFDATELYATLKKLDGEIPEKAVAIGLFQAANALLKDAIYVSPMAPKDVGDLRGSARSMGGDGILDKPTKTKGRKAIKAGKDLSVVCGFNIVYAAKWHEVPEGRKINWTTDKGAADPGPKYLEKKMMIFGRRYTEIIGEYIREMLNRAKDVS